ncbi:MAG: UbiA family prenyltransferase [Pirellulaceae bacterium]
MNDHESRQFELTPDAPFYRRFGAWLKERFPLLGHGILIVSYYSSNQFLAEVLTAPDEKLRYTIGSLLGAITLFCIFFHLRVFDEHKDFEEDSLHYPDRVLQRGLISLRDLKIAGGIAIGLEILLSAIWMPTGKPAALVAVLVTLFFSWLMLKEFFVRDWLKQHFLMYAISHMMIMPLLAMVVFSFTTGEYFWTAPTWYWVYAFVGFFVTLNWEISRKIRSPDQEIEGVDSYTKIFGTYGAAWAVLIVRAIDTFLVALVGWHIGASTWFYVALIVLYCLCLIGFLQFRFNTNAKNAKRMETYAGLYIIAFDLILAIELIRSHGVEFRLWP